MANRQQREDGIERDKPAHPAQDERSSLPPEEYVVLYVYHCFQQAGIVVRSQGW